MRNQRCTMNYDKKKEHLTNQKFNFNIWLIGTVADVLVV